jgi:hypothetical protein
MLPRASQMLFYLVQKSVIVDLLIFLLSQHHALLLPIMVSCLIILVCRLSQIWISLKPNVIVCYRFGSIHSFSRECVNPVVVDNVAREAKQAKLYMFCISVE